MGSSDKNRPLSAPQVWRWSSPCQRALCMPSLWHITLSHQVVTLRYRPVSTLRVYRRNFVKYVAMYGM